MSNLNGAYAGSNSQVHRLRLPTVQDALQFSPLTSIVPFSSDVILLPEAVPVDQSSSLPDPDERALADRTISFLNSQASNNRNPHLALKETLQSLQKEFSGGQYLTRLNFKTPSLGHHFARPLHSQAADHRTSAIAAQLQPFPRLLLDTTNIQYRHSAPASVKTPATNGIHSKNHVTPQPSAADPTSGQAVTLATPRKASSIPAVGATPISSQGSSAIAAVVVPVLPPSSGHTQYQHFPDLDAAIIQASPTGVRKRKPEELHGKFQVNEENVDQRQQGFTAVVQLKELAFDIFEAEDNLEPDTSLDTMQLNRGYFVRDGRTEKQMLGSNTFTQLEQAIAGVQDVGRYGDIPIEALIRLQKLCSMPLTLTSTSDLALPEDNEEALDQWLQNLEVAESSLRASRVVLRMMAGDRNEKQLYSEEVLLELLGSLKHVLETCIIPVVERKSTAPGSDHFKSRPNLITLLTTLLQRTGRNLKLLGDLLLKVDLSESVVTSTEFLAIQLIFVENAYSEKDSLLGIQKFETVRRHAMDLVAKIFLRHPEQRSFIFDEILTSLEKLPVTRQNARHFKLVDGKPIQLVSALIMLLIQTSAVEQIHRKPKEEEDAMADDQEDDPADDICSVISDSSTRSALPQRFRRKHAINLKTTSSTLDPLGSLMSIVKPLFDSAQQNSSYVGKYLVQRAMTSTKTGDQPYRNLLDIFIEDFINVLGLADWPAAELLLRALLSNLIGIADNEKSSAPAKNMALEVMGLMGSGIADLQTYATRACQNLELTGTNYGKMIAQLYVDSLQGSTVECELFNAEGPCRAVFEHYQKQKSQDLQTQSARAYFLAHWARNLVTAFDTVVQDRDIAVGSHPGKVPIHAAQWLQSAIKNPEDIAPDKALAECNTADVRLSYALVTLNLPFCKAFRRLISVLLTSLNSPHATVRSRSLKGITQLLEKDPSILERFGNVLKHIMHCTSDSSPLVRDSALGLLGRCLTLQPSLETDACRSIVTKTMDAAIVVRKRAMKLLRDIFLRNKTKDVRAMVADALLHRLVDVEEPVAEMARQTVEEIWFTPFQDICTSEHPLTVETKQNLLRHAFHIVLTVQRSPDVLSLVETLLKGAFNIASKNHLANLSVSRQLVSLLFDNVIDNESTATDYSQQNIFQTLTIFAKSSPRLFTAEQMTILKPYIENLSTSDDLIMYRSVLIIFRHVLPVLPPLQEDFLRAVQSTLFNSITKLPKSELVENAACLSIIDGVLKNTDRLARLMISVLEGIEAAKKQLSINPKDHSRVIKYMTIAGCFGKTCHLDEFIHLFRQKFPSWTGESVSDLIIDVICPLARSKQPLPVREMALDSMCMTCQLAPKSFLKHHLSAAFTEAFRAQEPRLELIILSGIKEFYETEEDRSKTGSEIAVGAGAMKGAERLGKSMVLNDNDGATTSIAQQYLSHILRIALSSVDELAVTATEVIASTNRQGLVHPKETGPALVALETSSNSVIADIALTEHRNLHSKHESMLEKEYITAIEQAFDYQRDTIHDVSGVDAQNFPKLRSFYDVLKSGSLALRKKLLGNLCTRLDHDSSKARNGEHITSRVQFTRFVLENLSLLEYGRIDELLHLISCIEKIFAKSGNALSQRIEASLHLQTDLGGSAAVVNGAGLDDTQNATDITILKELTASAMTLCMFWETRSHLRRLWNLQMPRDGKTKSAAKDVSKPPTKSSSVYADKHLEKIAEIMASLASEDKMLLRCKAFVDLLSTDNELRITSDQEEEDANSTRFRTPSEEGGEGDVTPKVASGGGKRKASTSVRSTPSKPSKRGRPSMTPRKRSRSHEDIDGEGDWE